MNRLKAAIFTLLVVSLSGCATETAMQQSESLSVQRGQMFEAHKEGIRKLEAAGFVQYDLFLYGQSAFAKTNDAEGFIRVRKAQIAEEEAAIQQAIPAIATKVRNCAFHSPDSYGRRFIQQPDVCFAKLSYADKVPLMVDPARGLGVPDERIAEVLAPIWVEWNAATAKLQQAEANARAQERQAAEDQRARAQAAAAKRAYDNSIQSLVE